ncbi:hypothetical protein CYMTET_26342 [Cymbomonas tetramitiformis]|uniref:Uncharacterized protein n=1 Tax=Cymbomonas tetramitiformis TaxID=36881 RepID=A0AAE0KY11_9CHLO|nr:hypothetical protein CYMTET_26342 [Cymbomonas tetramitiformis]
MLTKLLAVHERCFYKLLGCHSARPTLLHLNTIGRYERSPALFSTRLEKLDEMFDTSESTLGSTVASFAPIASVGRADILLDFPLWRVQWAALPGYRELLHVHVPHYCDMFGRILNGPKPWRFGHLYLPGGSASLSKPDYALEHGSLSPMVGCVMQISSFKRLPDGRLMLDVYAVGAARSTLLSLLAQGIPHASSV